MGNSMSWQKPYKRRRLFLNCYPNGEIPLRHSLSLKIISVKGTYENEYDKNLRL
jgi:hypothetical protein